MTVEREAAIPVELQEIDTHPVICGARILVVDDTPANLVAIEAALEPLKRQIITASTGQDALGHLLEQEFALVLLDVRMPGMDGFEVARWIRTRERTQHLPIMFITAQDPDETSVARAYELGAVDFLVKPFKPEVLRAKASVFVTLQERTDQLAVERIEREFENRKRDFETEVLRRERDREALAKRELARLNEALAEHDRRKDSFLAILAHELRNPLAPLQTCVDLAREQPDEASMGRMVDIVERQTKVLVRLVDDLLDVSRIKADKIELRPERVDLRDIIDGAVATSRPLIDERRHIVSVNQPTEPVMIVADTIRLGQVLCNLLNNAARYTEPSGRIEIELGEYEDSFAFVRISDNGAGIPPELRDTIFKMFVQERVRSDGSGGLGLGLALAKRLVEMHNGTIACTSDGRGSGSSFEVRLPLLGSSHAVAMRKRTEVLVPVLLDAEEPRCIRTVVIDDNEDARELVSDLLRRKGYDVLTAADGPTGLGLIREHQPDVALVDLGLPVLDGFGVVEILRKECPELKTRLIALTGYGQAADQERTKQVGFHAHLVKPASAAAIVECVREQLAPRS